MDSRIALSGQPVNFMLPGEAVQRGLQTNAMAQKNAMAEMAMRDKAALDQAYRESGGDISKMRANPNMGFEAGMQIESIRAQQANAAAQAQAAQIEKTLKGLEISTQLLGAANDQAGWDSALQEIGGLLGPDAVSRFPKQFDPSARDMLIERSIPLKDRLAMQRDELRFNRQMQRDEMRYAQQDAMLDRRLAAQGSGESALPSKVREAEYFAGTVAEKGTPEWQQAVSKYMKGGGETGMTKEVFNFANTLRDEFNQQAKEFTEVQTQVDRIKQYVDKPSAAGDQAIIFAAMKANDPTSTVRESEFAMAASAGGYGEQIKSAMTKVQNGEMLTPQQRQDFLNTAKKGYEVQKKNYDAVEAQYKSLAEQSGIDPNLVITKKKRDVFGEEKKSAGGLSDMDRQALEWANQNAGDPRADAIKKRLGM